MRDPLDETPFASSAVSSARAGRVWSSDRLEDSIRT